MNCFHDAVIIEAHGSGVATLYERAFPEKDVSMLLPHLSIGYTRTGESGAQLLTALLPFRDAEFGSGIVNEVFLCEVPAAKSTLFTPWRVLASVKLRA